MWQRCRHGCVHGEERELMRKTAAQLIEHGSTDTTLLSIRDVFHVKNTVSSLIALSWIL